MVNIAFQALGFIFAYFTLFTNSAIASTDSSKLFLFTEKNESVIGRPIYVNLYGVSLSTKIDNIDLSKLNENFGVVSDHVIQNTRDKRWPDQKVQILKLKLYPRHIGNVSIPSLVTKDARSKAKTILIKKNGIELPKLNLSSTTPFEREQMFVNISVVSNDSTSRLSINDSPIINGFESAPLPFNRIKNKDGTYLLSIGLAITPLKQGKQKIEIPPIKLSVSGVYRKLFYLPISIVDVKSLPMYLPPTVPVGKVSIQSKLSSKWLLNTNTLSYWDITISGDVSDPYRLPGILRQITSNKSIKFLPAKSVRSTKITDNNITSIVEHSIPFKTTHSGFIKLPQLKIDYFDPENGKIRTITYFTNNILSLNLFWRSTLIISISLLFLYITRIIYIKITSIRHSVLKRAQAVNILNNENSALDLREAIKLLAEAENWPSNTTLEQWRVFWKDKYQTKSAFDDLITSLSSYFYGSEKNLNTKNLSLQLVECVKHRKRH